MEWKYWMSYLSKNMDERWTSNQDLVNYMQTPGRPDEYAQLLMMTMPHPRFKAYQHKAFSKQKDEVLGYTQKIIAKLGVYPVLA